MDLKNGYPFWLIKNGLPYNYPKLRQHIQTDALIVGGGISGALTAHYLMKAGIDCMVTDGRTIGLGSTCASTSLLQYELDLPLYKLSKLVGRPHAQRAYQLCSDAIDSISGLMRTSEMREDFRTMPSLYYAAYKKDVTGLKKELAARKAAGFDVQWLGEEEIKDVFGFAAPGAILSAQGAYVNAYMLTHSLLQHCMRKGMQVFDRTQVKRVHYHPRHVEAVTQEGFTIRAKHLVYATGYEAQQVVKEHIVTLHSTYALASEQLQENAWQNKAMIWNTADPYLYMRMTGDNRVIVGGRDEPFYNPGARDRLLKHKTRQLSNDFKKLFPDVPFAPEFSWTGTFGITRDALPYIGRYEKLPRTYFALGFGGNGITFSVIAARIIADLLKGVKNPDAAIFSFDRHKKR